MITFRKTSVLTGRWNEMPFDMDKQEFEDKLYEWHNGELIQNVFPMLTPDEREFIMTGITPEEWGRVVE